MELSETKGALHAFNIPLIAVGHAEHGKKFDNILSTAPDVQGQAKVLNLISLHFYSMSSPSSLWKNGGYFTVICMKIAVILASAKK